MPYGAPGPWLHRLLTGQSLGLTVEIRQNVTGWDEKVYCIQKTYPGFFLTHPRPRRLGRWLHHMQGPDFTQGVVGGKTKMANEDIVSGDLMLFYEHLLEHRLAIQLARLSGEAKNTLKISGQGKRKVNKGPRPQTSSLGLHPSSAHSVHNKAHYPRYCLLLRSQRFFWVLLCALVH